MNSSSRHRLCAALLLVCLCIAAGMCQYVEDSIDVGGAWVGSLAYNPEQDEVWGASWGGNCVFAISCDSNKVVSSLALDRPSYLAHDSAANKAYVAFKGADEDSLAVIDGSTHQVVRKLQMPGATMPVWDPVSDRVYVSCQTTNSVAVVDCATDSLLKYIPVGACPIKMYINTLRRKLYVLNFDDGTVSIVDMATNQVIKTVDVGGTPNAGYYCRSADKFYSAGAPRQCIVIGGQSDTIVARITLPGNVEVLSATGNEDDGLVYLGAYAGSDDYVATVSAEKDSVLASTLIGRAAPYGLAYFGPSGLLYCASSGSSQVFVLTGDGTQILTTMQVGDCPVVFAVVPRHNRLYLGHSNTSYVYVLRDTSAGIAEPQSPRPEFLGVSVAPNPFTQSVAVVWHSPARGGDAARVYAQDGRLVRQAQIPAGEYRWVWDGRDSRGKPVRAGIYFCTLDNGANRISRKIVLTE